MKIESACWKCGVTFEPEWSEDDAWAEFEQNFPGHDRAEVGVLCDECYDDFWAWAKTEAPELSRK